MSDDQPTLPEILDDAWDRLNTGDLKGARTAHRDACRVAPDHRDVALLEVELLRAEEQGEEAVAACEEALERFPGDMVLTYALASLLLDIYDDVPGARPMLEELLVRLDKGEQPVIDEEDEEILVEAREDFRIELLLTLSDCRAADRDPFGAAKAAEAAFELAKDDPQVRVLLASTRFDLGQLDEAARLCAQAVDLDPRLPDAYWLRGRILTLQGDAAGAARAFERASLIDPDRFSRPVEMDEDSFAKVMQDALSELPEKVQQYLQNVAIAVEDLPPFDRLKESDPPLSPGLLGLYEGTPPSLAQGDDPWAHHPRHITLFRKNLEVAAQDEDDLRDLIATTLWHEIGHFLGLDEDDLDERGLG